MNVHPQAAALATGRAAKRDGNCQAAGEWLPGAPVVASLRRGRRARLSGADSQARSSIVRRSRLASVGEPSLRVLVGTEVCRLFEFWNPALEASPRTGVCEFSIDPSSRDPKMIQPGSRIRVSSSNSQARPSSELPGALVVELEGRVCESSPTATAVFRPLLKTTAQRCREFRSAHPALASQTQAGGRRIDPPVKGFLGFNQTAVHPFA